MERTRHNLKWIVIILVAVIAAAGILRLAVLQPYIISSSSMEPTLFPGDRIIVNRLAYRLWAPNRGDIVVFAYPKDPKRTFVKRIIALEGETVEIQGNQVYIDDKVVREPYLKAGDYPAYGPQAIPKGKVLVLGDNRQASGDSRDWGLLDRKALIGKAWWVYYPLNRIKNF